MAEEPKPNAESEKTDDSAAATQPAKAKPTGEAKPAAAKKAKAPAVEDKPFTEFMQQDFTPALQKALSDRDLKNIELSFTKAKLPLAVVSSQEEYWQVIGKLNRGQRQFNLYFLEENINGKKAFSYATNGGKPSTIESFMIDERKVTLDLLLMYTLQRLNGQKWLARN